MFVLLSYAALDCRTASRISGLNLKLLQLQTLVADTTASHEAWKIGPCLSLSRIYGALHLASLFQSSPDNDNRLGDRNEAGGSWHGQDGLCPGKSN